MRMLTDEELAELLARGRQTADAQLAASEMRRRESWRSPARWALIIAGLSLVVSIGVLIRSF